jgi:hypothetical protein
VQRLSVAPVQTTLQKRILRAFVARGLLENCDAKDMLGYKHSGFSVDAGVCIEAHDRAALERLLRYCARPPFSMERLRKEGSKLVYLSVHLQCVTFELSIGTNTFKLSPNQRLNVRSPVRYANPDAPNE